MAERPTVARPPLVPRIGGVLRARLVGLAERGGGEGKETFTY